MFFIFSKKNSWFPRSIFVVFSVFFIFVYHINAQESPNPQTEPEVPAQEPVAPPVEPETQENTGLLGDFINFVQDVVTSEEPENQDVIVPENEVMEKDLVLEPEISLPAPVVSRESLRRDFVIEKENIDYQNKSASCTITPFSFDVSNSPRTGTLSVKNLNQIDPLTDRYLDVGTLPSGVEVVFTNEKYTYEIEDSATEFSFKVKKNQFAQKGSFTIPVFYTIGEVSVLCQMNVVNHD